MSKISFKEAIAEIKALFAKVEKPEVTEPVVETIVTVEEPPVVIATNLAADGTNDEGASDQMPDLRAMAQEIEALRTQVNIMAEWVYLKQSVDQLEDQIDQINQGFARVELAVGKTVDLVEKIANEPSDKPAEKPKDSFQFTDKKKNLEKYFSQPS